VTDPQAVIRVEYCVECNYLQRATWMVTEILADIADSVARVEIVPGHMGAFEWSVDGQTVFSKNETGRFPELDDLKATIYACFE
jgi:selenoprotein W-related protein